MSHLEANRTPIMVNFDSLPPAVQELLERPSSSPPKGVQQNLDNPRNYNDEVLPIAIICIILVGTSVFLRIYSRVVFSKRLRIEDCRYITTAILDLEASFLANTL